MERSSVTSTVSPSVRFALLLVCASIASAYYLPGYPQVHAWDAEVTASVNTLRSQLTLTPYEYYYLPLCRPPVIDTKPELVGEILFGDIMQTSPFVLHVGRNESCVKAVCRSDDDKRLKDNVDLLEKFINYEYRAGVSLDNLAAYTSNGMYFRGLCDTTNVPERWRRFQQKRGFAIGTPKLCTKDVRINNHLHFDVKFHKKGTDYTIVGLSVLPYSINHQARDQNGDDCNNAMTMEALASAKPLTTSDVRNGVKPFWSYSATWTESDREWPTRWDDYLNTSPADSDPKVHWTMIINGILIALCISAVAGTILMRTLHKDFNRYNSDDPDERQNEMGWKLVHADVFRPPRNAGFLSIVVASGVQVVLMSFFILFFALLGFLAPSNRGVLLTTLILVFVLLSFVQGYVCGRLLVFFDKKEWKTVFASALFFPGLIFIVWFCIDLLNYAVGAADAVGWRVMGTVFGLVFIVDVPLVVFGAGFAFRQPKIEVKIKVGKLAREIPLQRWYHSPPFTYLVPPIVPLSIMVLEFRFILSSLWEGMVYYVFGFLALVCFVWTIVVILTTIVALYYQLTFEDYRWWWRSIVVPGGMGLHVFLYCVYWYYTQLNITTALGSIIFFGYMGLASLAYGLAAGAIGFISGFLFISKIYSSIKLE